MIDYENLENYYTGVIIPVTSNFGGIMLELGEDIPTVLYKMDETTFVDVNDTRRIGTLIESEEPITTHYVVAGKSLEQVTEKKEITRNVGLVKRLTFKPENYQQ